MRFFSYASCWTRFNSCRSYPAGTVPFCLVTKIGLKCCARLRMRTALRNGLWARGTSDLTKPDGREERCTCRWDFQARRTRPNDGCRDQRRRHRPARYRCRFYLGKVYGLPRQTTITGKWFRCSRNRMKRRAITSISRTTYRCCPSRRKIDSKHDELFKMRVSVFTY